jgi:hypothetical protein
MQAKKDYEENAATSAGSYGIPCFRWITSPEVKNQSTTGNGVCECRPEMESNGSNTPTERAQWNRRNVTRSSGAGLLTGNVCPCKILGDNVQAGRDKSACTI